MIDFVFNKVIPVLAGVAFGALLAMAAGCVFGYVTGTYFASWAYAPAIDSLFDRAIPVALLACFMQAAWFIGVGIWYGGELLVEWLVMRSSLYKRVERENQFWIDSYKGVCAELNTLRRRRYQSIDS